MSFRRQPSNKLETCPWSRMKQLVNEMQGQILSIQQNTILHYVIAYFLPWNCGQICILLHKWRKYIPTWHQWFRFPLAKDFLGRKWNGVTKNAAVTVSGDADTKRSKPKSSSICKCLGNYWCSHCSKRGIQLLLACIQEIRKRFAILGQHTGLKNHVWACHASCCFLLPMLIPLHFLHNKRIIQKKA